MITVRQVGELPRVAKLNSVYTLDGDGGDADVGVRWVWEGCWYWSGQLPFPQIPRTSPHLAQMCLQLLLTGASSFLVFWPLTFFSAFQINLSFIYHLPINFVIVAIVQSLSCIWIFAPRGLWPTRLLSPWGPQARMLEWVPLPSPGDLPDLCLTYWQMDSLPLSHQEPIYLFIYLCMYPSISPIPGVKI